MPTRASGRVDRQQPQHREGGHHQIQPRTLDGDDFMEDAKILADTDKVRLRRIKKLFGWKNDAVKSPEVCRDDPDRRDAGPITW